MKGSTSAVGPRKRSAYSQSNALPCGCGTGVGDLTLALSGRPTRIQARGRRNMFDAPYARLRVWRPGPLERVVRQHHFPTGPCWHASTSRSGTLGWMTPRRHRQCTRKPWAELSMPWSEMLARSPSRHSLPQMAHCAPRDRGSPGSRALIAAAPSGNDPRHPTERDLLGRRRWACCLTPRLTAARRL